MSRTVRIRAKLLMNADGQWAIHGWNDAEDFNVERQLYDMMGEEDVSTARLHWIVADVPVPDATEIAGQVDDAE